MTEFLCMVKVKHFDGNVFECWTVGMTDGVRWWYQADMFQEIIVLEVLEKRLIK